MQSWPRSREVEKVKQVSVASLPEHEQDAAMEKVAAAGEQYPSVLVAGRLLHVFEMDGEWQVWLNTEDMDFTGLCVSVGDTRDEATAAAVRVFEAAAKELQKPA